MAQVLVSMACTDVVEKQDASRSFAAERITLTIASDLPATMDQSKMGQSRSALFTREIHALAERVVS